MRTSKHGPLKFRDTRPDGKIFWGYNNLTKANGRVQEMWYSPEAFAMKEEKVKTKSRAWNRNPKNQKSKIKSQLKRNHGISTEDYDILLANQDGLCAICKKPETNRLFRRLAVDHCHDSNMVRGLLCNRCNKAIGLLEDSIELLAACIDYIRAGRRAKLKHKSHAIRAEAQPTTGDLFT